MSSKLKLITFIYKQFPLIFTNLLKHVVHANSWGPPSGVVFSCCIGDPLVRLLCLWNTSLSILNFIISCLSLSKSSSTHWNCLAWLLQISIMSFLVYNLFIVLISCNSYSLAKYIKMNQENEFKTWILLKCEELCHVIRYFI